MNKDKDINKAKNDNNTYLEKVVKASPKTVAKNKIKPKKKKKKPDTETGKKKLTLKQKRFIDNYIISGNATDAAIKAGYSKKTAAQCGADNLRKSYIKQAIDEQLKKIEDAKIATATEVLQLLTAAARGEWDEEQIVVEGGGWGVSYAKKIAKRIAPRDRIRAAELLAKRYGLTTERVEIKDDREKTAEKDDAVNALLKSLKEREVSIESGDGDENAD